MATTIPTRQLRRPTVGRARGVARETATVRVAFAVIALHLVDDAFVHPESGTAMGDHFASGLVPTAMAVLLATAYPRLGNGWQAATAIGSGVLALVGGVGISARHVVIDRLAGDDLTGILAGLAGIMLIGCGIHAAGCAWRAQSRRVTPARRALRRLAVALAVLLGVVFVVFPAALSILATHKARAPVAAADLGRPYEQVSFRTSDGLVLQGWYVPSRNRAAVITFPGRSGPVPHARMLVRHGYGVLLFDRRGEGASQGDFNAFGWEGERDLTAALRYLTTRTDVDRTRIGGIGLSVGGELLLQTAADSSSLRAVVADGAGMRSLRDHLALDTRGPISWISPLVMQTAATAVLSNGFPPPALLDLMPRIAHRAVFLIFAGKGQGGEDRNPDYYAAARQPKQLWEIPEAGHTGGLATRPAEYERRVVAFFDQYLLGKAR